MNKFPQSFVLILLIKLVQLNHQDLISINSKSNVSLVQGDILVRRKPSFNDSENVLNKTPYNSATHSDSYLWPNGEIPYLIDYSLEPQKCLIEKSMKHIMFHTCIRFRSKVPRDVFYIRIFKGNGCYSSIGRDEDYPEGLISLGSGCYHMGTVVHELMHSIGFHHAHTRHDRDRHIRINFANVHPDNLSQFEVNHKANERLLIGWFDYHSIMMYGPRAFSKDGQSITIEPKNAQQITLKEVFDKRGLTRTDARSVNRLYKCLNYRPQFGLDFYENILHLCKDSGHVRRNLSALNDAQKSMDFMSDIWNIA